MQLEDESVEMDLMAVNLCTAAISMFMLTPSISLKLDAMCMYEVFFFCRSNLAPPLAFSFSLHFMFRNFLANAKLSESFLVYSYAADLLHPRWTLVGLRRTLQLQV